MSLNVSSQIFKKKKYLPTITDHRCTDFNNIFILVIEQFNNWIIHHVSINFFFLRNLLVNQLFSIVIITRRQKQNRLIILAPPLQIKAHKYNLIHGPLAIFDKWFSNCENIAIGAVERQ